MKTHFFVALIACFATISCDWGSGGGSEKLEVNLDSLMPPTGSPADRSGKLTEDEVWEGHIRVTGDVTVRSGVTLRILPGTQVWFVPNQDDQKRGHKVLAGLSQIDVEHGGRLVAEGTPSRPIIFSSEGANRSSWGGIGFRGIHLLGPAHRNSMIKHCVITNAHIGVYIYQSEPQVLSNLIANCGVGVYASSNGCRPAVKKNEIRDCDTGIETVYASTESIHGNRFSRNGKDFVSEPEKTAVRPAPPRRVTIEGPVEVVLESEGFMKFTNTNYIVSKQVAYALFFQPATRYVGMEGDSGSEGFKVPGQPVVIHQGATYRAEGIFFAA